MISYERACIFDIGFRHGIESVPANFSTNNICSTIEKDIPTGNLTEDIDITINPTEALPANGTVTISTDGATDKDINEFPSPGVSVIIQNDKVIVTNNPVAYE